MLASFAAPELRFSAFLQAYDQHGWAFGMQPGFWLFATPILAATLFGLSGVMLLMRRRPDRAEGVRLTRLGRVVQRGGRHGCGARWGRRLAPRRLCCSGERGE